VTEKCSAKEVAEKNTFYAQSSFLARVLQFFEKRHSYCICDLRFRKCSIFTRNRECNKWLWCYLNSTALLRMTQWQNLIFWTLSIF
jgi:hypothetical protein